MADTLAIVRRLEAVGVDRDVVEAHADAIQTVTDERREHLATKADLARVEARIDALEVRLTWRMVDLQFATAGVIVAALKLIP